VPKHPATIFLREKKVYHPLSTVPFAVAVTTPAPRGIRFPRGRKGRGGEWRGMHMMEAGGIRCSLSHSPARAVSDGARCWENLFTCSRSTCFRIVRGDKDDPFSFLFFFSFSNACLTCWWLDDKVGSSAEAVQYYKYYMQMFSNDLIGQCRRR